MLRNNYDIVTFRLFSQGIIWVVYNRQNQKAEISKRLVQKRSFQLYEYRY